MSFKKKEYFYLIKIGKTKSLKEIVYYFLSILIYTVSSVKNMKTII